MTKNVGFIRNPLTIIGIFSTLTEGLCIVVLPHITDNNQSIFIWFVMSFPFLLLIFFFYTLINHHTKLYAPGDFSEDNVEFATIFLNQQSLKHKIESLPTAKVIEPQTNEIASGNTNQVDFMTFDFSNLELETNEINTIHIVNAYFKKLDEQLPKHKFERVNYEIHNISFFSVSFIIKNEFAINDNMKTFILQITNFSNEYNFIIAGSGVGVSTDPGVTINFIISQLEAITNA